MIALRDRVALADGRIVATIAGVVGFVGGVIVGYVMGWP